MTYVMSDVHGHYDRFLAMLSKINFQDSDDMIILGDVIDRGPNGIKMLQDIMGRKNIVMTMGNHELMMIDSLLGNGDDYHQRCIENWIQVNGGHATMLELESMKDDKVAEIISWLGTLPIAVNLTIGKQSFHLVHAWPAEDCRDALWSRPELDTPNPFNGDTKLIVGHTPVMFLHANTNDELQDYIDQVSASGDHLKIEHAKGFIDIDCGLGQNLAISRLACLRLNDMEEFYV